MFSLRGAYRLHHQHADRLYLEASSFKADLSASSAVSESGDPGQEASEASRGSHQHMVLGEGQYERHSVVQSAQRCAHEELSSYQAIPIWLAIACQCLVCRQNSHRCFEWLAGYGSKVKLGEERFGRYPENLLNSRVRYSRAFQVNP